MLDHAISVQPARSDRHRPRVALVGSLVVAALGLSAFVIVKTREVETTEPTLPAAHVPHTPAVIEVPAVEDEHSKVSWDRVAIAPGTVGWFEIGNLPSALAARVGTIQSWSSAANSSRNDGSEIISKYTERKCSTFGYSISGIYAPPNAP